jgi:hypothetical protein
MKRMTLLVQYETAGTISGMIPSSLPAATRAAVHVKESQIGLLYEHPSLFSFT